MFYITHTTTLPAFSHPELLAPNPPPAPVDVDVFGIDSIVLPVSSCLYPAEGTGPFWDFTVDARKSSFTPAVTQLESGVYVARYLDGAIMSSEDTRYNKSQQTEFSNGKADKAASRTIWLRLANSEYDMYYFKAPAFTDEGCETEEEAEQEAMNSTVVFWHPGGPVDAIYDDAEENYYQNTGEVGLRITPYTPGVNPGPGYWSIVFSSLPDATDWPFVFPASRGSQYPQIFNIKPGIHVLRYNLSVPGITGNYQDFYIRAWNMPPRMAPAVFADTRMNDIPEGYRFSMLDGGGNLPAAPSLFPVKPKRIKKGKGTPVNRGGTPLHQLPKYSGNEPERPESNNTYQRPQQLGPTEKY